MNNTVHCCMQTNMHKDLFVRKCELTEPTPECSWLSTLRAQICSVNRQGRGHQSPQVVASIGWRQSLIRATRVTFMQKPHANAAHSCLLRVPAKLSPFGTITGEKRNQSNSFLLKRAVITPCFCFLCDDHIPASLSDPISTRSQLGMGAKLLLFSACYLCSDQVTQESRRDQQKGQTGSTDRTKSSEFQVQLIASHTCWWERPLGFWKLADWEKVLSPLILYSSFCQDSWSDLPILMQVCHFLNFTTYWKLGFSTWLQSHSGTCLT